MASAPPANSGLPLLFNDLAPLSSVDHATWKIKQADTAPFLAKQFTYSGSEYGRRSW